MSFIVADVFRAYTGTIAPTAVGIRSKILRLVRMTILCVGLASVNIASASDQPFGDWLSGLKEEALSKGISNATFESALGGATPIERVIELDRNQPEGSITFTQYLERTVPQQRINRGRRLLAENRATLNKIMEIYNVQPRFVVALWGIETDFGRNTGGFSVPRALATLAHDGRRSPYFRGELISALQILEEKHISPNSMTGSWAGAMGQCQFMPSSFLEFAIDFDKDGRRDIWQSRADVFASAANYLSKFDWQGDQTWGRPVTLPANFDASLVTLDVTKKLADWQALGVRRANGTDLPVADLDASLVRPGDDKGPIFIVYGNYRATLKWNRSTYFALAVGHLADRIVGR
jgi:membrane-bound lytic murein transglycosylase B